MFLSFLDDPVYNAFYFSFLDDFDEAVSKEGYFIITFIQDNQILCIIEAVYKNRFQYKMHIIKNISQK